MCPLTPRVHRAVWHDRGVGTVLAVLGVLVVVFVAALVGTREGQVLADAPPDRGDPGLPADGALGPDDVAQVRFAMALRGYRMAEVDALLERLAQELRDRDAEIAALGAGRQQEPPPAGPNG